MGNTPVNGYDPNGEFFLGTVITGFIESAKATLQTVWDFGEMVFSDHSWKEFNEEYRSNMRNLDPTKKGTRFNNAIRIDVGSFKGDFGQIMSRWTWELPQTTLGKSYGHLTNNIGRVKGVGYFDGATIVNVTDLPLDGDNSRGVALGSFIYG